MKSALMRLWQPGTSFSEPMGSVHINMCSDEILSWLSMFWCLELTSAAVTMPVLDRPSERPIQIRQAARQAFVESQDDTAMRRALVARPCPWREFQVGDQIAFRRKGKGRGMRHGHARWRGQSSGAGTVSWIKERVGGVQTSVTQGVTGTIANGHRKGCG